MMVKNYPDGTGPADTAKKVRLLSGMLLIGFIACVAPAAASSGWGDVQVWSTPGNAYVQIDNYWAGWTDDSGSLTITGIPGNAYQTIQMPKNGYMTFRLVPHQVLLHFGVVAVLTVFAAFLPARKAANMHPVEALRA